VTPDVVSSIIEELSSRYEFVIIDTQSVLSVGVVTALMMADKVFFVVDDSIVSTARLVGSIDYLKSSSFIGSKTSKKQSISIIKNKKPLLEGKYTDIAELPYEVSHKIPYIKNLSGFGDKRLLKHTESICKHLRGLGVESE